MSEKRPISLHNSDLFLKPEFTESNEYVLSSGHQKELNLDTFLSLLLQKLRFCNKKGPSLGENNHIKTLYTSDLLPRLKEQKNFYKKSYLNKAVKYTDPPISAESEVIKKRRLESATQRSRSRVEKPKHEILTKQSSVFVREANTQNEVLHQRSFARQSQLSPLKYELGSGFLFHDKAQESQNKYYLRSSHFAESAKRSISDQTSISQNYKKSDLLSLSLSKHTFPPLNAESSVINSMQTENQVLQNKAKLGYSVFNKRSLSYKSKFLLNLPSLIRSGISREFLLVAINLVLLSILATVQRNNSGFACSLREQNEHQANACKTRLSDFSPLAKVDCVIKPWYCMKAYNTSNDNIVATRSVQEKVDNSIIYKNPKIQGFQYYTPYYTSQERIFAESDTIPEKRGSIYSKTVKKLHTLENSLGVTKTSFLFSEAKSEAKSEANKSEENLPKQSRTSFLQRVQNEVLQSSGEKSSGRSSITTSQFILKRFFYKYGFFVIEPLKKSNSFLSKEEQNYLTRSPYTKNIKQLGVTETKNNTINQIHDQGLAKLFAASTSTPDSRILPQKIQVNVKSSCIPGDHINLALYRNVNTPYFSPSVNQVAPVLPKPFVCNTFVWSKYNLSQVKPNAFAEVKSSISTFNFIPDTRVQNISVSGYKFPELKKKEIVYLFRQRAILDFYVYLNKSNKKKGFDKDIKAPQKLLNQITAPFHKQSYDLINQVLSARGFLFWRKSEKSLNKVFTKSEKGMSSNLFNEPDLSIIDPKMQYTQVNLDSIGNVKKIFSRMGRNYENYLRQPKDSLPALIISPSLEDDREIEEEGIQIFRKRDLIKNAKNAINTGNAKPFAGESVGRSAESFLSENVFREKGDLNPNNTSFFTTQENSQKTESKSEIQNRQILVKNALRQAQEEIDNIAKKEEKGSDKEKQVIPPLTRLEALYTIRNRERKREQAKDLTSSKSTVSFEELFLYSDKQSSASNGLTEPKHNCIFTPWLFSKLGDENICTDRKHSFFGEMSLLPKKLTAQEQKQIFQQKANPLLKVNDVVVGVRSVQQKQSFCSSLWFDSRTGNSDQEKMVNLDITQSPRFQIGTRLLPETMLGLQGKSLLPEQGKQTEGLLTGKELRSTKTKFLLDFASRTQNEVLQSLPSPIYFYNNLSQNKACQASAPKIKGTPLESPVYHRVWQPKRMEPSTFRVSSRSQSTPVIPRISQKDWKNMIKWQLKKYFFSEDRRLLPLSLNKNNLKIKKINLYLPWISIQKAENIVNNQALVTTNDDVVVGVRSVFASRTKANKSEATMTKPLSPQTPKQNISLNKAVSGNEWPLTRLDLRTSNPYKNEVFVNLTDKSTQLHGKTNNYWRLPVQQTLSTITWPVKTQQKGYVQVKKPQKELGIGKKVRNSSILFESVTTYSWLFVYTFVFVLMFKQLFNFVYKVGFKDFFIKFLNSDFGRTITGEEFRYSIQNLPLTESYMPKKRLQELLGLEKNKVQLLEVVWFLRNNCQGRNGPRGILLVGPPGVENVSVVQAIAGEAKVPIIVQSLEKIAQDNEPQRQLEQLYMRAHKQAPCVLFLDQLDTIGARRDQLFTNKRQAHNLSSSMASISDQKEHKNTEMQNSVNSGNKLNVVLRLLTILDGITQSSGVVTVATAQDLSKLDPALLRPKRFDRRIYLSLPNQQDRVNLFKIQTQSIGHIKKMPWDYLSLQTENMSTADIKSAINYSLFRAVLKNSVHTLETLEYGIDCVLQSKANTKT